MPIYIYQTSNYETISKRAASPEVRSNLSERRYIITDWEPERIARLLERQGQGFEIETRVLAEEHLKGRVEIIR